MWGYKKRKNCMRCGEILSTQDGRSCFSTYLITKVLMSEGFGTWGDSHVTSTLSGPTSPKFKPRGAGTAVGRKTNLTYFRVQQKEVNRFPQMAVIKSHFFLKWRQATTDKRKTKTKCKNKSETIILLLQRNNRVYVKVWHFTASLNLKTSR